MERDRGVRADYVERAFRESESVMNYVRTREAEQEAWRSQLEALAAMQAARPLKPPGR